MVAIWGRIAALLGLVSLGSLIFSLLATPFQRVIRERLAPKLFDVLGFLWLGAVFLHHGEILFSFLAAHWLSISFYAWLGRWFYRQDHYRMMFLSSLSAMFLVFLVLGIKFYFLPKQFDNILAIIRDWQEGLSPHLKKPVWWFFPGLLLVWNLVGLVFALLFENFAGQLLKLDPVKRRKKAPKMLDFRLSEPWIWPFLISLALALFPLGGGADVIKGIIANVLIVYSGIFFLQGLAVLEFGLLVIQAGLFIRLLVYVLIGPYIYFILLGVGLVDFWWDLRRWIAKIWLNPKSWS